MQMLSVREAMEKRHSVRSYLSTPIPQDILLTMKQAVKEYASAAKMRIQLVTEEPDAFKGFLAVELFTQLPVRLYVLAISLQSSLTAGITGFGTVTIGDVAKQILENFSLVDSIANLVNLSIRVLLSKYGAPIWGVAMVWYAVPIGWLANFVISFCHYRTGKWKKRRDVQPSC